MSSRLWWSLLLLHDTDDLPAAGHTDVCSKPTLTRPLEQGTQTPDIALVPFRLRRLHLPQERKEPLV